MKSSLFGYFALSSGVATQIIDQADYADIFADYDINDFEISGNDNNIPGISQEDVYGAQNWENKNKIEVNAQDYTHFSNQAPQIIQVLDATFDPNIQYTNNGTKITESREGRFRTDYVHDYGSTCGTVDYNRIVNGEEDEIKDKPWMMNLLVCGNNNACYTCGAALVSDEWALTAAHCLVLSGTTIKVEIEKNRNQFLLQRL